jgi:replicative DNA helicase|nr:MAG TPA: replicative helicase [Caudoviricetes sp.]
MDLVANVPTEVLFVGCIYKQPDLLVNYGQYVRSKYDFSDEVTRFFYDSAEIIYKTRSQTFNKTTVSTYFSEEPDRLSTFKKYGGWKTIESWIKLAITDDIQKYQEIIKKYSLLREYQRNGFDISKIVEHKKFEQFTASDIYRLIRGKADRIHTVILTNQEAEILNSHIKETLLSCMEKPDLGVPLPFPILNDIFRGCKLGSTMAVGMLSNAGKTRFMTMIIAYLTLVNHERVFVMLNEMGVEDLRKCLVTTIINNKEFQKLHGIKLKKPEKELTLGLYKNNKGEYIYQKTDDFGEATETTEEYIKRVSANSEEYNKIMKIAEWIEAETNELILVKDMASGYDDKTLEFEIRKANLTHGAKYFFYDTCKQDVEATGDWAALKATVTKLTDIAKQLEMFGYLSIQLTDDTEFCKPDELNSNNIANAKQLKHIVWTMALFKEISPNDFHKYRYVQHDEKWGKDAECELQAGKRYYAANVDKNRFGCKKKVIFEVDLDLNTWVEVGELRRK